MQPPASDDDDAALFRTAVAGARRLIASHHHSSVNSAPSPLPRQQAADDRQVLKELLTGPEPEILESGDTLSYRAPGVQDTVMIRLRRGHYRIERELDLHGLNRDKAQVAVLRFLGHCRDRGHRCVRIIHGKGNGSPNSGPVIKSLLGSWLRRRQDVVAFCSARPADGGTGAVYVLLRSPGLGRRA